ncbi:carbohydrate ABC transporter permease [Catonella massiliensis]|uniref:Sugar ABC transporter permease n=1 Tax=Catonella massiliensis TaxID=2799636 RepID=A0ABS1IYP6_9FIRM|nr:sugar ABC transporter permease [Catonella massiliensis]MBK5896940.1 sugar ABC transporter permease [Catonella massiliensis]
MKREKFAYTLLAPMIIIMLVLVIYPIAATFSYSLKKWKLSKPNDIRFIGLKNYINILSSESFLQSVKNTLFILVAVVIITTIISILVALFLNIKVRFSGVLLAIAIVPWAIPPFVNALLWKFVFYSGYGFLNKLLLNLHLISTPISWLDNRYSLLFIVSIVVSYRLIPFMSLICLAGRQSISGTLIEAAKIDGAGRFMVFKKIITPLMLPFLAVGITQTSISAINVFDEIVALSGYSDLGKSMLIESYLITFNFLEFGKGSAYTYIIMVFAGILGFVYIKSLNREVEF